MAGTQTSDLLVAAIGPACHEMRSPLAVVYGFAKMLQTTDGLDEQTMKYADSIANNAGRLADMVESLSRMGRIVAGRIEPSLTAVGVRASIAAVAATADNAQRVSVEEGPALDVAADPEWLAEALHGIVESCCFDESSSVSVSWSQRDDDVAIRFAPRSQYDAVDGDPVKACLALDLARVRVFAMGGSITMGNGVVLAVLPVRQ